MFYRFLLISIYIANLPIFVIPAPNPPNGESPFPPYLQNVTDNGRKAYTDIVENDNLTIIEIEGQVETWAKNHGVLEEFKAFQASEKARSDEIKHNVTTVIAKLPSVQTQLDAILDNKSLTKKEQKEAIETLSQRHPKEVDNLYYLAGPSEKREVVDKLESSTSKPEEQKQKVARKVKESDESSESEETTKS